MAEDVNANIRIGVDTSDAITSVKNLQRQIALLNAQIATGSKTSATKAAQLNQQLVDGINATGRFAASMTNIKSSTEAFTTALEKNKLSMGQYFRYSMGATRTFGRFFGKEFDTIQKVAIERTKDLQTQFISLGRDANGALRAIKVRPLSLDMTDLSTRTMIAAQKMQLMGQLMKQGSTQLLNWGKNTQWAGRQLMVGFTIPLTMFGAAAIKSFTEIEKQILKIQRVYGDFNTTVEDTKQMTDQIRALAQEYTKYGVAVTDTLNLAADAAAAGKTGQELLSQISEATRLAVLGNVEQTQALETTMSITNAFGTAAEDLAGKIDFLNAVENQSVTSIEDLTEAIPKAGPVVQQLGGDVEDLAFFLTAMKEGGINASEGANALKSGLASLINPTGKAKEMLAGFGINIEKIVESNKGDIKGLVIDFATALDTLDPLSRARAIEQLFGKFQFSRLSTLFQNVIGEGTQAQRVLELANASTQELAILSKRELGKIEQTTTYKFEKALADFQAAIAPVGEEFLKLITPVIEFGTKLLQQFNNMDAGVKQFVVGLTAVLGVVFPALLMTVGLFANGIANILKLVSALTMVFKRTSGDAGILGNQFEYMTQAEIQAAAAAASLDQVHSKLRQTFTAEKAAVDALTTAYQRNIAAQKGALTGGASTRRPKPAKGYAKGVVSVPGPKGAGDVVPAMLSPGEAVIPAKMAKKYGGLINGMIADNIPGYKLGLEAAYAADMGDSRGRAGIPAQIEKLTAMGFGEKARALEIQLREAGVSVTQARRVLSDAVDAAKKGSTTFGNFMKNFNASLREWNASGSRNAKDLISTLRSKTGQRLMDRSKSQAFTHIGSGSAMSAREYVDKYGTEGLDKRSADKLAELLRRDPDKAGSVSIKSGLGFGGFSQSVNQQLQKGGASSKNFLDAYDQAGVEKWNDSIKVGGGNVEELADSTRKLDARFKEIIKNSNADKIFDTRAQAATYIAANPGKTATSVEEAYALARKEADPKLRRVLDTAQRTATGVRVAGAVTSAERRGRRAGGMGREDLNEDLAKVADRENRVSKKEAETAERRSKTAKEEEKTSKTKTKTVKVKSTQQQSSNKPRIIQSGNQYYSVDPETGKKTRVENKVGKAAIAAEEKRVARNARDRERYAAKKEAQRLAAETPTKKPGLRSRIASGVRGMGGMGLGMGVSMAGGAMAMIPGLEGVGTALAMVGPLFMMLPPQIAGVVAGLGVLVAGIFALNAAQEEQRKKAVELGNSLGMGSKELNAMAEDMGTVSLTQQRQAEVNQKLTETTEEQISAGEQYLTETDSGKALVDEIKTLQSNGLSTAEIGDILGNKISYAVSQNVITQQQGEGIIAALGVIAGNIGISTIAGTTLENTQNLPISQAAQGGARTTFSAAKKADTNLTQLAGAMSAYSMATGGEDIINQRYDALVEEAKLEKEKAKTKEAELLAETKIAELEVQRNNDLKAQRDLQKEIKDFIETKTFALMRGGAFNAAPYLSMMKNTFGETSAEYKAAQTLMTDANSKAFGKEFLVNVGANLATGDLDPAALETILSYAKEDKDFAAAYNLSISTNGDLETLRIVGELQALNASGEQITVALNLVSSGTSADDVLGAYQNLLGAQSQGLGSNLTIDEAAVSKYLQDLGKIEDAMPKDGKFTAEFIAKYVGSEKAAEAIADSETFQKLPKKKKAEYIATYTAFLRGTIDKNSAAYTAWKTLMSKTGEDTSDASFVRWTLSKIAGTSTDGTDTNDTKDYTPTSPTGGQPEDKKLARFNKIMNKRQKALDVIALRENAINKRYDERKKALEEIAKINSQISDQQRAQLDVASALASGDIAAAARAIQAERARAAQFAQEQQMAALEDQRQRDLSQLSYGGRTRAQLEAAIAAYQLAIAKREYTLAAGGGLIRMAGGGKVMSYFAGGGKPLGSDTVPAMLTPGEFVVKRPAVQGFGVKKLEAINNGKSLDGSVYNYNVNVNVATGSDPDKIARSVVTKIKSIDKQRLGGNSY